MVALWTGKVDRRLSYIICTLSVPYLHNIRTPFLGPCYSLATPLLLPCYSLAVFFLFVPIFVKGDAFHLKEAGAGGLDGAEACVRGFSQRSNLPLCDKTFQLLNAVPVNVFVYIVVPLATNTLK